MKRVKTEIKVNDKEKHLLIIVLRDVEEELKEHNLEVLERNKHKKNYLVQLNKNNLQIKMVEKLLKKLE